MPTLLLFFLNPLNSKPKFDFIEYKTKKTKTKIIRRYIGPAIVRINLFVRSIATISDIKMVSERNAKHHIVCVCISNVNVIRTITLIVRCMSITKSFYLKAKFYGQFLMKIE